MIYHLRDPQLLLGVILGFLGVLLLRLLIHELLARRAPQGARRRWSERARVILSMYGLVGLVIVGQAWLEPVTARGRTARARAVAHAWAPIAALVVTGVSLAVARAAGVSAAAYLTPGPGFVAQSGGGALGRVALGSLMTAALMLVLSLIPVPPLDAGEAMLVLAPRSLGWQKARYQLVERNVGLLVVLALVLLPVLLRGFPSVPGALAGALLRALGPVAGISIAA